jgi:serine/threonine-protein kinase RIO1
MGGYLLNRDLAILNKFFSKLGVEVLPLEECYKRVTGSGKD